MFRTDFKRNSISRNVAMFLASERVAAAAAEPPTRLNDDRASMSREEEGEEEGKE